MRFLHTGDWHVGKTLRGRSRASEHRAVLAEIAALASDHAVDFVLVAGDLFDSGTPTPESEEIVYRALLDLSRTGATVVVIAGNHDSGRRIRAVQPLLELASILTCAYPARADDGGVFELSARSGGAARIAVLPFLSQRNIIRADALMRDDADKHTQNYAERATQLIASLCDGAGDHTVNVLLAHAMVHGGERVGSERAAHTVFEYSIPTTAFPSSLHYVALGHLHRAQELEAPCPVHYCGSPLQLDFGEAGDVKSVQLVEASPGSPASVRALPLGAGRPLRRVAGTLSELAKDVPTLSDAYLRVDIDEPPTPGLAERVRELLPDALEVRLLQLPVAVRRLQERQSQLVRSPQELFASYLEDRGDDDPQVRELFADVLEEVHATDSA